MVDLSESVAVCITTHNRPDLLAQTLKEWHTRSPEWITFIVVDDGSNTPVKADADVLIRHDTARGIAAAKNRCLSEARNFEHVFLADDDIWPVVDEWWKPYVNAGIPHMMYLFEDVDKFGRKLAGRPKTLWAHDGVKALARPRGCLLYVHESVRDRIGGFRSDFGRWGGEHEEYSTRAYYAGLTPAPFCDVADSHHIWHSMDERIAEHLGFRRSVPPNVRREAVARNEGLRRSFEGAADYIEYREPRHAVLTCLLTSQPDQQRGIKWSPNPEVLDTLLTSLRGCERVVMTDELAAHDLAEVVKVPALRPVYLERWFRYLHWLENNPDVKWVWCVDGSDVKMIRQPWQDMKPGTLYMGCEPCLLGANRWMLNPRNHAASLPWLKEHPGRLLLNMGVVGGDRQTVMDFCRAVVLLWREDQDRKVEDRAGDMGLGQRAAEQFNVFTGPQVVNVFKSGQDDCGTNWWAHK